MLEDIFRFALQLRPDLDEMEQNALRRLCAAAEETLKRRLRSGFAPVDCKDGFICAAAWMAVDCLEADGDFSAFTAGNVSVKREGKRSSGSAAALKLLAPFLKDGCGFVGVRV